MKKKKKLTASDILLAVESSEMNYSVKLKSGVRSVMKTERD